MVSSLGDCLYTMLIRPSVNNGNPIGKPLPPRKTSYFEYIGRRLGSSCVLDIECFPITLKCYHARQY